MTTSPSFFSPDSERGGWRAALAALALVVLFGFGVQRLLRRPAPAPSVLELARALAISKYEELSALPPGAPELALEEGIGAVTHDESGRRLLVSAGPGFDPPDLRVSWTVEPVKAGNAAPERLRRVSITVRQGAPLAPALARLDFVLGVPR